MDDDEPAICGGAKGAEPPSAHLDTPVDDPFRNWPNGDLLSRTEDQAFMWRHNADVAPLLDWPELREVFTRYDAAAAGSRRRSRRFGLGAMIAGFLSLVIAAVMPLLGPSTGLLERLLPWLGVVSAALGVSGIVMGYTQVLRGEEKARWLGNRVCAERARQFHFQLIINNLPAAVRAIGDPEGAEAWRAFRADVLDILQREYLQNIGEKLHILRKDHGEADAWILPQWREPEQIPAPSDQLDRLLAVLGEQRFGIQKRYSALKLSKGWHSPVTRSEGAMRVSDDLTLFLLLATIVAGGCAAVGLLPIDASATRDWALALAGVCSAGVIALRVLDQGLQMTAEAERYQWYNAAVEALEARFLRADSRRKIDLLREIEHLAYQEMRRFVVSFEKSRFVG